MRLEHQPTTPPTLIPASAATIGAGNGLRCQGRNVKQGLEDPQRFGVDRHRVCRREIDHERGPFGFVQPR